MYFSNLNLDCFMMIDYSYHFFLSLLSFLSYYYIPKHVDLEDLSLKKQELSVLFIYQGYRYWEVDYEIIIIVISDFETWYFMNNFL